MSDTDKELYELAWREYERSKWLDQLAYGLKLSMDRKSISYREGNTVEVNKVFIPTIIEALEKL